MHFMLQPQANRKRQKDTISAGKARDMAYAFKATFARYKPHLSMVVSQIGYAISYFITEAAFNQGLNPNVYVTYRYIIAGLLMLPFAYFLERNSRPKLTVLLFAELFFSSLLGIGLTMNMYFASLKYTSPTFLASIFNSLSPLTFVLAIIFRMEVVDVKNPRGIAKIVGTLISLAGVTTITLYKGPAIQSLRDAPIHITRASVHDQSWVKGSILAVAGFLSWAIWYITLAITLKKYPAELSLTTWVNFLGGALSAVFAVILHHEPSAWSIKMFSVGFWAITSSALCSGLLIFIQFWCIKEKGPVFVVMFNPLQTVTVVVLAYLVLGEKLYTGSIIGGVIVIIGLYLLLWGKEKDTVRIKSQEQSSPRPDELKAAEELASANREEP